MDSDTRYQPGELVFCTADIYNDGGIPDLPAAALLAQTGTRGVIVKAGHIEETPSIEIYLVRFEGADAVLGPPVGCLGEELTQTPPAAVMS